MGNSLLNHIFPAKDNVQKKGLVDRLLKDSDAELLLRIKDRFQRAGICMPTVEVRFQGLTVETHALVGKRAVPSFTNFYLNIFEGIATGLHIIPTKKKNITILKNVNGILKPGRMTLLLGAPGSGKTTLLSALAGKLDPNLKVSGCVTYNGHTMDEFVAQRTSAYVSQKDVHIGELTVRETLTFAARCHGVGPNKEMLDELLKIEKDNNITPDPDIDMYMKMAAMGGHEDGIVVDYILKILGLEDCSNTKIGDQVRRGISGGQKKRVTIGEMLVGPYKTFFMDEISNGLDSWTTYKVISAIKHFTHIFEGTVLISLLQPDPEVYKLFDDVILFSQGQIVYQGPIKTALEFFEYMGFKCPERKGVPDYLQEVVSKNDQNKYWAHGDEKQYEYISTSDFVTALEKFEIGERIAFGLRVPFDKNKSHPHALATRKYGVPKMDLFRACAAREFRIMARNSFFYVFRISRFGIMALIIMTLFFRAQLHKSVDDGLVEVGSIFYIVMTIMFSSNAEAPMVISKLVVIYKQRGCFYPTWAYGISSWIIKIPTQMLEVAIYWGITYYVIGYDPNFGRFLKQYLILFVEMQAAIAIFRFIGAVTRNPIISNSWGFVSLLVIMSMGGFILSREKIKKWWIWAYYISPMMYAQNALVVNEFTGHSWNRAITGMNESLGIQVLKSQEFFTESYWYFIGLGALIGITLLYNLGYVIALSFLNPLEKHQIIAQEGHNEIKDNASLQECGIGENDVMVLPFEPHSITFSDITYSIDIASDNRLMILNGVTGVFRPGILTALMGVSGAGKTTLMDVLAGRKTHGYTKGNIKVSGYPKNQDTFARIFGYCEQNDIHSPNITVYESLIFSAWLRLSPEEINDHARKVFVEKVMDLVELNQLRSAIVGVPGVNGLSAEQRKRLTIAVELVANPSIIFMDEPTSGLDSRAAAIVMRTVRNTVDIGRTVVCTIHQPSIDIFETFDQLFLMKEGGEEIYVGPLGQNSSHLISYFENIEGVPKIKNGYNPAMWMLEIISSDIDFGEIYRNSELYRKNKEMVELLSNPLSGKRDIHFWTKYSQPMISQFFACLWKLHWSYWHSPLYTALNLAYTMLISVIVGSMFWDLGSRKISQRDLINATGCMLASFLFIALQCSTSVQPVVSVERNVTYRERAVVMYSSWPYALAQIVIEIPYIFVQTLIYGPIVYTMIGFEWTIGKFMWYMYFIFFSALYASYFGMAISSMTATQQMSSILSAAFYSLWVLFSGFPLPIPRAPIWWRWYYYINPTTWTLHGLTASQFGDVKELIENNESVQEFIEDYFGYKRELVSVAAMIVFSFGFIYALVFAVSMKVVNFQKR